MSRSQGWGRAPATEPTSATKLCEEPIKQAGDAKVIRATTTSVRERSDLKKVGERTERVKVRNRLAAEIMKERGVPTNDLFGLVEDHSDWYSSDGTHFNAKGKAAQAKQVAESVATLLPSAASSDK